MRSGLKLYPSDPSFPIALAQIAHSKEDWKEAIVRWALVRKRFPGVIEGYTQGANALTAVNQLRCANALCIRAMEQFPDAMAGYHEYARLAVREKDWQEALRRWEPLQSVFPYVGGFVGGAQALINLGRYDEADAMLRDAFRQFVNDPSPFIEYARSANARGDIGETLKRWKSLLERFPLYMHGYFYAAEAFERLNQPAEAEAALRAAADRFGTESRPLIELAKLYHFQRLDFPAAADAWATVRKAFPELDEAYRYGAEALERANRHEEALALRAAYTAQFGNVEPSNGN
jgi:tetratricopeptide (TPR) repeat protein